MHETLVQSLGRADLLEKEMATHSRILAWKIPWTEEPGGLWSVRGVAKSRTRLSDFPFTFLLRQCQVGTFYMVRISAPGNTISQHHLKFVPLRASLFCRQTQQCVHHHSLTFLQFSSVHSLSCVQLFVTPWTVARQASLSITNSRSLLKLMSIKLVMPSSHLISVIPFSSCPQSFPASGSFPMSQFFSWGGQSIGASASASVLPMDIHHWFPLGWTGWIFCSPRDSQESSPTPQFKSINSSALSFLHSPTLTSIHDYWKNHSFD